MMPTSNHRNTFEKAEPKTQMLMLYDKICDVGDSLKAHSDTQSINCAEKAEKCDKRFQRIENGKVIDKTISAASGFFGGASVVLAKWFFFKG